MAYAHALATAVGVTCDVPKRDINGWDVVFRARDTETADAAQLAVQLKCTVNRLARVAGGRELSFPLGADDFDNLRRHPTHPPRILVVVEAPQPSPSRWIHVAPKDLLIMASAWYLSLAGRGPLPENQQSTNVHIPISQRFTPSTLLANMRSCP